MKLGLVPVSDALGAVLAHTTPVGSGVLKKGRVLSAADVAALADSGHAEIMAARLDADDVGEDTAAARIAARIAGEGTTVTGPFTGRVNIHAAAAGIALIDARGVTALNRIDEGITVATVAPYERVSARQMLATVKIIPFALPGTIVAAAGAIRLEPIGVAPFISHAAGLVMTRLPQTKDAILTKRERAIAERLSALGSTLAETAVCAHDKAAVAAAVRALAANGCSPILIFAASAIIDRDDVVPAGVAAAGGEVAHLGMPVDPGNLLMLGRLGGTHMIGIPSCAASPKLNGFDWVLERILAGVPVTSADIAAMGVGGLLKEIATRPQPREGGAGEGSRRQPRVAAIVLAAGRSTRMGERNKLTEEVGGKAIVRRVAEAATASRADPVVVVTGHRREEVAAALAGLDVATVYNADFASGLAGSLKAGIAALPETTDGAVILLGDMPEIETRYIDRLIAAFAPKEGRGIVVPVRGGKRGNPVLWSRDYFAAMARLDGDTGARSLLAQHAADIAEVDLATDAVLADIDTPEALAAARARQG